MKIILSRKGFDSQYGQIPARYYRMGHYYPCQYLLKWIQRLNSKISTMETYLITI